MDNIEKFSGRAKQYTIGRPAYASAMMEYLYGQQGFFEQSVIADIGSGTGKFAKQLLDRGSFVYCVEPNDDMRDIAIKELGGYERFHAVNGTAGNTTLVDHSVEIITVAQAFHWFDVCLFQQECKRILKPNGKVVLIWNVRDLSSSVNQDSYALFAEFCPQFQGFNGGIKKDDERIKQFFQNDYKYVIFNHPLFYSKDQFISRSLSSSYSLQMGDTNYQGYIGALEALFEKYANHDDILEMPNHTVAYIGEMG